MRTAYLLCRHWHAAFYYYYCLSIITACSTLDAFSVIYLSSYNPLTGSGRCKPRRGRSSAWWVETPVPTAKLQHKNISNLNRKMRRTTFKHLPHSASQKYSEISKPLYVSSNFALHITTNCGGDLALTQRDLFPNIGVSRLPSMTTNTNQTMPSEYNETISICYIYCVRTFLIQNVWTTRPCILQFNYLMATRFVLCLVFNDRKNIVVPNFILLVKKEHAPSARAEWSFQSPSGYPDVWSFTCVKLQICLNFVSHKSNAIIQFHAGIINKWWIHHLELMNATGIIFFLPSNKSRRMHFNQRYTIV